MRLAIVSIKQYSYLMNPGCHFQVFHVTAVQSYGRYVAHFGVAVDTFHVGSNVMLHIDGVSILESKEILKITQCMCIDLCAEMVLTCLHAGW